MDELFQNLLKTHNKIIHISESLDVKEEIVDIILRSCLRIVYRTHEQELKRVGKQLRFWLREAQQGRCNTATHKKRKILQQQENQ